MLSRNKAYVQDYTQDPLTTVANMTARMGEQSIVAMNALQHDKRFTDASSYFCSLPVLLVQGSEDKVTSVAATKAFFARIANRDKEIKLHEGLYHCIFDEPEADNVMQQILDWLNIRFSGAVLEVEVPDTL